MKIIKSQLVLVSPTVSDQHVSAVCAVMFVYEGGDAVIFAWIKDLLPRGSAAAEILPSVAPNQQRAARTFSGSYSGMSSPHTHHRITDYTNADTVKHSAASRTPLALPHYSNISKNNTVITPV